MGEARSELAVTAAIRHRPAVTILCTLATLFAAACEEKDVYLPGKREPITAVLSGSSDADTETVAVANEARDIRLPAEVANSDAAQDPGTQAFRTDHPSLAPSITGVWSVKIGEGDGRKHRIVAEPVVSGGRVFTLDAKTTVSAVSASGALIWQRDVLPDGADDGDATGGGLAVDDGVLYVSTGYGALIALDTESGSPIWTQSLAGTASGRPTVFGDMVYVVSGDDVAWALNKSDGRIIWQLTAPESGSNILGAPAPVVTNKFAIFGFGTGELQAVFRTGGLRRWNARVVGERKGRALSKINDVTGQPIVANGVVYAGNQSGRTVALDVGSGERIWSANEGAISTVLPVGGSVFLISDRNELLRLSAADGGRIWGTALPNFTKDKPRRQAEVYANHGPILAGGRIIVSSSDGVLRSFDPVSGALVDSVEIPGGASTGPVVAGQTLYLVSRNGQLLAYR